MLLRRALILTLVGLAAGLPASGNWLVFRGGTLQEIDGTWEVRGGQLRFHSLGGALMAVRVDDVDLPASTFLSWQVGDWKAEGAPLDGAVEEVGDERPCVEAKVLAVQAAETLQLAVEGRSEVVHLACLDGPEGDYPSRFLSAFGVEAARAAERLVGPARLVCVRDEDPSRRDGEGHRIVSIRLGGGRDLTAALIAEGYGLTRSRTCDRAAAYQALEGLARQRLAGHWGPASQNAAAAVITQTASAGGAIGAPRPAPGGG